MYLYIYIYLFIYLSIYDIYHSGQGITIFSAAFMRMSHLRSPPWRGGHKALELPMAPGAMVSVGFVGKFYRKPMGFYHQIGWAFRLKFSHHPIL